MSHHRRIAREQLSLAEDHLESAEALAEHQGEPTTSSLAVERVLLEVRAAIYAVNTANWREAEVVLVRAVAGVSRLGLDQLEQRRQLERPRRSAADREHAITVTAPLVDQLVHARRSIRKAILNLRLSKDRPT